MSKLDQDKKTKEVKMPTYKIVRKYTNQVNAEESLRKVIAQHMKQ